MKRRAKNKREEKIEEIIIRSVCVGALQKKLVYIKKPRSKRDMSSVSPSHCRRRMCQVFIEPIFKSSRIIAGTRRDYLHFTHI